MAVKTITIDLDAYDLLARRKKPGQSFSEVIKERFGGTCTGADLLNALPAVQLEPASLDAIDQQVRRRRSSPARAPRL
jgi:predicted CopG family antitoxin